MTIRAVTVTAARKLRQTTNAMSPSRFESTTAPATAQRATDPANTNMGIWPVGLKSGPRRAYNIPVATAAMKIGKATQVITTRRVRFVDVTLNQISNISDLLEEGTAGRRAAVAYTSNRGKPALELCGRGCSP